MKEVTVSLDGTIYYASKDYSIVPEECGGMISDDKVDITKDAIKAVAEHLVTKDQFQENRCAGYEFTTVDGAKLKLMLYDKDLYTLYSEL